MFVYVPSLLGKWSDLTYIFQLISKLFDFYGIFTKHKKISWDFSHAKNVENNTFFGQTSKVSCVSYCLLEFNLSMKRFVSTILGSQSIFSLWFRALKNLKSKISMFHQLGAWCQVDRGCHPSWKQSSIIAREGRRSEGWCGWQTMVVFWSCGLVGLDLDIVAKGVFLSAWFCHLMRLCVVVLLSFRFLASENPTSLQANSEITATRQIVGSPLYP